MFHVHLPSCLGETTRKHWTSPCVLEEMQLLESCTHLFLSRHDTLSHTSRVCWKWSAVQACELSYAATTQCKGPKSDTAAVMCYHSERRLRPQRVNSESCFSTVAASCCTASCICSCVTLNSSCVSSLKFFKQEKHACLRVRSSRIGHRKRWVWCPSSTTFCCCCELHPVTRVK